MAEPHWSAYVGMITGIIGTLTGVSGAIMGYISYRKTSKIKQLDLRLELKKSANEFHSNLDGLEGLLERANKSRRAVAAAAGFLNSGRMQLWDKELEEDRDAVLELKKSRLHESLDYSALDTDELETKIVKVHHSQQKLSSLVGKYEQSVQEDNDLRKTLRR